jgi:hypothetical protein
MRVPRIAAAAALFIAITRLGTTAAAAVPAVSSDVSCQQ